MALSTKITQIVTLKDDSITVEKDDLNEMFSSISDNTPVIVISVIGCQDIGKSLLLNYMLEFLKAGCNHSWCISGMEKFQGFNKEEEKKESWGIKAYLVPITFIEETFCVLILDAEVNDHVISSTLNSKLHLICMAITNILLYIKPNNAEVNDKVESDSQMPGLQDPQLFKGAYNTLYTLLLDTADEVMIQGNDGNASKSEVQEKTAHDDTSNFLKTIFEKNMTVLLPKHSSEPLPADFQGQLKSLNKNYKDHLKPFLMNSFLLNNLLKITKTGKCYSQGNNFIQMLLNVVGVINGSENSSSLGIVQCQRETKTDKSNPIPSNTSGLMKTDKLTSGDSGIKLEKNNDGNIERDITAIVKELEDCILSVGEVIRKPAPGLFENIHSKYEESIEALKAISSMKNIKKAGKNLKFTLDEKIKTFTIEKKCINELCQLQILLKTKFAEQLYFPIDEFKTWVTKTKTLILKSTKTTRSTEIPEWFEFYLDIILGQAEALNKEIRDSEIRAVEEALSTAVGAYKQKIKIQTDLLIFKPKDLNHVNEKTINFVKQSLEYAIKLENRKNIALDDFNVILRFKQQASIAFEDSKSESMHENYTVFAENATKAASKAFKMYQSQLEENTKSIKVLKITKLYEFHTSAKDNALNLFSKELQNIPKELIEPFSKGLSEDIDREHKRIRDEKINSVKSIASASTILGIQFGLAEIRFGVYANGNPLLYKLAKGRTDIPNVINLSEGICVGEKADELYKRGKGGLKLENILLDNVGKVYDTNVMGTAQKLPLQVIITLIFEYIKSTADEYFNQDFYQCVISVPNAFDHIQRQMIKDSASLSGFEVLQLLSESTAAAVTFRCAPEFKKHLGTTHNAILLVQCYKSYSEVDSSSIFDVNPSGIKMLSTCSPAFLADVKKTGIKSYLKSLIYTPPTDIEIILHDAIQKSKVEVNYVMLINSGQSKNTLGPDKNGIIKFCHNILPASLNTSVINGTIYYAHEIKSKHQFSVSEALQYNVVVEVDEYKRIIIERNSPLPLNTEVEFHLPSDPLNLVKFQGEKSQLGKYSIAARPKSAIYHSGQIAFNFDHSALLSTKGCLFTYNGREEVYVTEQTENINELKKREVTEKLKEIHSLEKNKDVQKQLRAELQKDFERIKTLISRASLSQSVNRALDRTIGMCREVLQDQKSNTELLTQQLKALKTAEETFLN